MLGQQNPTASLVHRWFDDAQKTIIYDRLLDQQMPPPPPLLFVDTFAVSNRSRESLDGEDEFAIFQTSYKDSPTEVSDHQQRMVINATYATKKREQAFGNLLASVTEYTSPVIDELRNNLSLYGILHNEGHNRGHFVGAWAHEDSIKKNCPMYGAVEEFRACIGAIVLAEHLPLTELQKDAFALSVFMSRFFGFGYEAYLLSEHRRETVREITVGLMFFEWLVQEGVIREYGDYLRINYPEVRPALIRAFSLIYEQEANVENRDFEALKKIAREWYRLAFPNSNYSLLSKKVYNRIVQLSAGR